MLEQIQTCRVVRWLRPQGAGPSVLTFHLRHRYRPGLLVAVLCSLFVIPGPAQSDTRQELKAVQSQINSLQQELKQSRTDQDSARQALSQIDKRIGKLHNQLRSTRNQIKLAQQRLQALVDRQQALQQELSIHKDVLKQHLVSRFYQGPHGHLKALLSQSDITQAGRQAVIYQYLSQARSSNIDAATQQIDRLTQAKQQAQQQQSELLALQQQQQQQQDALKQDKASRQKVLAQLNQQVESQEQKLKRLKADAKQLQDVLERIAKKPPAAVSQNFAGMRGKLPWPVSGPLLAKFGQSRNLGELKWDGVLIGAKEGSHVKAIADGKVVFADWLRGYGLLLIIDHGQGYLSLYGHNQAIHKELGEPVAANEIIASVGNSGGYPKAGLYFEIRKQGNPTNPVRWCRGNRPG